MSGTTSLYKKHREWALSLVAGEDEDAAVIALVALWDACREYTGGEFRGLAQAKIEQALERQRVR